MASMQVIQTPDAPAAIGPYSQGVVHGGVLYTAGQIALDPKSGEIVGESVAEQTEQVLRNLGAVLKAAGASFSTVLKTTVFLRDMNDFVAMNEVYARYFVDHRPARATVQVARLPRDVAVEIELVAAVPESGSQG
ncbi:MAG TPA: RidA family protein [Longimicrobiaceae bacterium]